MDKLPFSAAALGTFIAPVWASAALLAAVATGHTVDVERIDVEEDAPGEKQREIHAPH